MNGHGYVPKSPATIDFINAVRDNIPNALDPYPQYVTIPTGVIVTFDFDTDMGDRYEGKDFQVVNARREADGSLMVELEWFK